MIEKGRKENARGKKTGKMERRICEENIESQKTFIGK